MALNSTYDISNLPSIDIARSKFTKNHKHITTFNVGELVPIFVDECVPGTTVNIRTNKFVRLQTLLYPLMDNIYVDVYYFFCPYRLVWSHFVNFMGENKDSAWYPQVTYQIPQLVSDDSFMPKGVADHFGIPIGVEELSVNALPFRAYALIWNEFFRDENLSDPILIYTGDETIESSYQNGSSFNYINDGYRGVDMLKVAKYRDLFTTALPAPQKGPIVNIPNTLTGNVIVAPHNLVTGLPENMSTKLKWNMPNTTDYARPIYGNSYKTLMGTDITVGNLGDSDAYPTNLVAYLGSRPLYGDGGENIPTGSASISINQLRLAFATQRLLERDARYGTRYTEIIMGHFGITNPDARLQRPELIGASHNVLNIDQVVETSGSTETYVLGETGGYSVTADSDDEVSGYTALESGVIIGLACCRYEHSYQQGLDKMWSRENRLDFYWPELSNIGEVGIKNKEIFCSNPGVGETVADTDREDIFGYQEAWYDYRNKKNYVSGEMRSDYSQSLDAWHLADDYSTTPILGNSWILEDANTVNRVLAVEDNRADQVLADFYFEYDYVAPIPMYSVPGLIDMR